MGGGGRRQLRAGTHRTKNEINNNNINSINCEPELDHHYMNTLYFSHNFLITSGSSEDCKKLPVVRGVFVFRGFVFTVSLLRRVCAARYESQV